VPLFQLLGGARGLDMPDGSSVQADRHGRVVVQDEAAASIRGSAAMRRYDAIVEIAPARYSAGAVDGRECPSCGRSCWPWTTECGRCGSALAPSDGGSLRT